MNKHARLAAATALAVALGLGASAPASASSTTKKDPRNDWTFGSGPGIDLAQASLRTRKGKRKIQVTLKLHEAQQSLHFGHSVAVGFVVNKRVLREVQFMLDGGTTTARVCSYRRQGTVNEPYNCSTFKASGDGTTFRTVVPLRKIKKGAKVLPWFANSYSINSSTMDTIGSVTKPYRWRL